MLGMSLVVNDAELASRIVVTVASVDNASCVFLLEPEHAIGPACVQIDCIPLAIHIRLLRCTRTHPLPVS